MKKTVLLLVLAATLTGCANLRFQWSAAYETDNLGADLKREREAK